MPSGRAIDRYLNGERLVGDDLDADGIKAWYQDESDAYFALSEDSSDNYEYRYHALNQRHAYRHLGNVRSLDVLGFGSAYGDELRPIIRRCRSLTIVEPADGFRKPALDGVPIEYITPSVDGTLPFPDNSFDLITCFAVLHHVPNVSHVVAEFARCLRPGGHALLREPTVSMGDWTQPRPGLTKRERGIPLDIFRQIVKQAGFTIRRERRCVFSLTSKLIAVSNSPLFNRPSVVLLDSLLSSLPIWPKRYHARTFLEKLRPTAVAFVLQKP